MGECMNCVGVTKVTMFDCNILSVKTEIMFVYSLHCPSYLVVLSFFGMTFFLVKIFPKKRKKFIWRTVYIISQILIVKFFSYSCILKANIVTPCCYAHIIHTFTNFPLELSITFKNISTTFQYFIHLYQSWKKQKYEFLYDHNHILTSIYNINVSQCL